MVFRPRGTLCQGVFQALLDDFFSIGAAPGQAAAEFFAGGRGDEDIDQGTGDVRVCCSADLAGSLDIDVHDHIIAALEDGQDGTVQGAVAVAVDPGVFQEVARAHPGLEISGREEVVVLAIGLSRARRAGGGGDGGDAGQFLLGAAGKGGFAAAGGAGEKD